MESNKDTSLAPTSRLDYLVLALLIACFALVLSVLFEQLAVLFEAWRYTLPITTIAIVYMLRRARASQHTRRHLLATLERAHAPLTLSELTREGADPNLTLAHLAHLEHEGRIELCERENSRCYRLVGGERQESDLSEGEAGPDS